MGEFVSSSPSSSLVGRGIKLKESLVFNKTKCETLSAVVHLNLWGSNLEDVSLVSEMDNVEIVSLSVNQISSLKDFSHCSKLQELYLRKNNVHTLEEIVYLKDLKHLKLLWLNDNPCSRNPYYKAFVLRMLPQLARLDNEVITAEDRKEANAMDTPELVQMHETAKSILYGKWPVKYTLEQNDSLDDISNDEDDGPGSFHRQHNLKNRGGPGRKGGQKSGEGNANGSSNNLLLQALMQKIEVMDVRQNLLEQQVECLEAQNKALSELTAKGDSGEIESAPETMALVASLERRVQTLEDENKKLIAFRDEFHSQNLYAEQSILNGRVSDIEGRMNDAAAQIASLLPTSPHRRRTENI